MNASQSFKAVIANIEFLETLYQQYQANPQQLHPSWQSYFEALETASFATAPLTLSQPEGVNSAEKIKQFVESYRLYGHLAAHFNPLKERPPLPSALIEAEKHFNDQERASLFPTQGLLNKERASLKEIQQALHQLYCNRVGYEYKGLANSALELWIQQKLENPSFEKEFTKEQKQTLLEGLQRTEQFESFLHTHYVGQKRFSLEGLETLIPMLNFLVEKGAEGGVEEIVLGMSHRGRLNVLAHVLNKTYKETFIEFEEGYIPVAFEGTGDVKYHKGYAADVLIAAHSKSVKIILTPNPSHLESVDPVVEGQTRAKQFLAKDGKRERIIPLLIHGDAALSGQGVVYETLQLSQLEGYKTGGTIHFVANNQIGFTTSSQEARSTFYCTDVARAFGIPVFHVNAEDPESCVRIALLALEIRQKFHTDVFVELNGYRKYGHNEGDEPAFTQPLDYQIIRKKKSIRTLYGEQLIQAKVIERQMLDTQERKYKECLQQVYEEVKQTGEHVDKLEDYSTVSNDKVLFQPCVTAVSKDVLMEITACLKKIPADFHLHPKVQQLLNDRLSMAKGEKAVDWGMGEFWAYATLLWEGHSVRLSGQDSERGTFSHRHAIWVDQVDGAHYSPLANLKMEQGHFEAVNSPLSEMGVLGFEYGYSLPCLQGLNIWEAQFGDFANGAQVIIDQYLISGEQKWGQKSNLVLLLPHGYEGQGPEHSSGRLERFLTLAGHENIQIVNPTTPSQLFHLLRRQVLRSLIKPLIIFTPKGLLRHPACVSSLSDFTEGSFQEILNDPQVPLQAKRLCLCSGRIYYDLLEKREKDKRFDIALLRIEQLYPLDQAKLKEYIEPYVNIQNYCWVQEEHRNMGGWHYMHAQLQEILPKRIPLSYIGRSTSASPATGSHSHHEQELDKIFKEVFDYEN